MDNLRDEQPRRRGPSYVLLTAAHNEEGLIEKTIMSVLSQTMLPERWVIVSDASTDRTDQIIEAYARQYAFIRFLCLTRPPGRSFGSKVSALRKGTTLLEGAAFDFIGNLDADVSVESSYFETLLKHFRQDSGLGIAAGFIHELEGTQFRSRGTNRIDSVPHAAQLVRRECYESIGGYAVLKYGGEDWYAQQCAKIRGWRVKAVPALKVFHHRHTGTATNLLRDRFRLGRLDYSLGSDPVFELLKCAGRAWERPALVGAIARIAGFCWSFIVNEDRSVSREFIAFLRHEQRSKVLSIRRSWIARAAD